MRTHRLSKRRSYRTRFGRRRKIVVVEMISPSQRLFHRCVRIALRCIAALVVCYALIHLTNYIGGYFATGFEGDTLRSEYYETLEVSGTSWPMANTLEPAISAAVTPTNTPTPITTPAQGDLSLLATLPPVSYPYNPYKQVADRFQKLRRRNRDIIGWLNIDGMIDEAVVQRDNRYYLKRDYLGYHNVNGALFLDASCDLSTMPYTYIIYGHNMKTGEMFGDLRKYEDLVFYKEHAIISFDTLYESGKYIVFSAAKVNVEKSWQRDYTPIFLLPYSTVKDRTACIERIQRLSEHQSVIDVQASDQLLILVTCDGETDERRIVVARKIRKDENTESIQRQIDRIER